MKQPDCKSLDEALKKHVAGLRSLRAQRAAMSEMGMNFAGICKGETGDAKAKCFEDLKTYQNRHAVYDKAVKAADRARDETELKRQAAGCK